MDISLYQGGVFFISTFEFQCDKKRSEHRYHTPTHRADLLVNFLSVCYTKLRRNLWTWIVTAWTDSVRFLAHLASVALPGYGAAGRLSFCSALSFTTILASCRTVRPPAPARPRRYTAISLTIANSSRCTHSSAPWAPGTAPGAPKTFSRTSPPCKCRYFFR